MKPKVISLVPSLTDFILRLDFPVENVIGRTAFCIEPEDKVNLIPTVGGTKKVNIKKIKTLSPDLVIMNHEENTREMYEELRNMLGEDKIIMTTIETLEQAETELQRLSEILGISDHFNRFIENFHSKVSLIRGQFSGRILYFIWKDPWMVAGQNTFIHSWLKFMGFENAGTDFEGRYPVLTDADIQNAQADLLLLSSEPYTFRAEDAENLRLLIGNNSGTRIECVDGRYFIWYGYKMLPAIDYFYHLFQK